MTRHDTKRAWPVRHNSLVSGPSSGKRKRPCQRIDRIDRIDRKHVVILITQGNVCVSRAPHTLLVLLLLLFDEQMAACTVQLRRTLQSCTAAFGYSYLCVYASMRERVLFHRNSSSMYPIAVCLHNKVPCMYITSSMHTNMRISLCTPVVGNTIIRCIYLMSSRHTL